MRQAGRSERRTDGGCGLQLFPPWREEKGPEVLLFFQCSCARQASFLEVTGPAARLSQSPAHGSPGPAAHPLLPRVHLRLVFRSCGFCCISGTTGLAAGCDGPRRGLPVGDGGRGASAPPPMVPMLSAPVLSHTGCGHRPPRQSRPAVRHTRPCSAPLSFLPPSPPGAVAPQPAVLRPDPLRCLHGAR